MKQLMAGGLVLCSSLCRRDGDTDAKRSARETCLRLLVVSWLVAGALSHSLLPHSHCSEAHIGTILP